MATTVVETNLLTNPSFETTSGTITTRTNKCIDPVISSLSGVSVNYGTGGAGALTQVAGGPFGGSFARATWTTGSTFAERGMQIAGSKLGAMPVGPVSVSVYVRTNSAQSMRLELTGLTVVPSAGATVVVPANTWTRLTLPATITGTGTPELRVYAVAGGHAWLVGDTLDVSAILHEDRLTVDTFFYGGTAAAGDFTYAWTGTVGASASDQRGAAVVGIAAGFPDRARSFQSSLHATSGGKSLRNIPLMPNSYAEAVMNAPLTIGAAYTFVYTQYREVLGSGAVDVNYAGRFFVSGGTTPAITFQSVATNAVGFQEVRGTFVANVTNHTFRLGNGYPVGDAWFNKATLVRVPSTSQPYMGPAFDGSSSPTLTRVFAWTGAANASTSTASSFDAIDSFGSNAQLWAGTKQKFQKWPMPSTGMGANNVGYSENGTVENGGGFAYHSTGKHREYQMNYSTREAAGLGNLDIITEYATGQWNDYATLASPQLNPNNLIYFADPMIFDQNLFAPNWATPMLGLQGDWHFPGKVESFSTITDAFLGQPKVAIRFDELSAHNVLPAGVLQFRNTFTIPIPPGYALWWGWSGLGGDVTASAHNEATGSLVNFSQAALRPDWEPRLRNEPILGSTYDYATFFMDGEAGVSSPSVTSMMAQLWPIGVTPNLNGGQGGRHIPGLGATGCRFMDAANAENYVMVDRMRNVPVHYKGLSTSLIEVGGWI